MTLQVTDMTGERVMTIKRPWTWNCCCCEFGNMFGCAHMEVFMGGKHDVDEEHKVGEVRMPCCGGGFKPTLNIVDKSGETKAIVKGPCCFISDMCGSNFEVLTPDGKAVGDVQKLGIQSAANAVQEATTDADNYAISFPKALNVEYKALMVGALLLLDYMFFEDEGACQFQPWRCVCKFKCCDMYCLGCICPCSCNCPSKKPEEGEGAPPAADAVLELSAPAAEVIVRAQ